MRNTRELQYFELCPHRVTFIESFSLTFTRINHRKAMTKLLW
jgi:hypothetical protein